MGLSGWKLKFAHLELEDTKYEHQGTQVAFLGFDELTHFTETQFIYMISRVRSLSGIPGYVRATCNPDPDSFVRRLIDWWIGPDGYPIQDRSGVIRWFIRYKDDFVWADTPGELIKRYGNEYIPKSLTFIPSKLEDNKILMKKDPGYKSNLLALGMVDQERLLRGNWNIRPSAGNYFKREWFPVIDAIPSGWIDVVRSWDRAGTKPNPNNPDPDWTRGLLLYKYSNGSFVIGDLRSLRDTPGQVERFIRNVASHDSNSVRITCQQDPGSAGVGEAENFIRMLSGFNVSVYKSVANKVTRAKPVSAQAEHGNIRVLRGPWNKELFDELESFPPPKEGSGHDDIVDALSGGFLSSVSELTVFDALRGH